MQAPANVYVDPACQRAYVSGWHDGERAARAELGQDSSLPTPADQAWFDRNVPRMGEVIDEEAGRNIRAGRQPVRSWHSTGA